MSGNSPSRRIRTKTSEFTDFFRGAAQIPKDPAVNLEVPSSDTESNAKKRGKIQLFGRSRKKSNQSASSSPFVSSRDSSDFGELSIRGPSSDRRPSAAIEPPPPPPLPRPLKPHSKSISSKLAATFGHSRLPKPSNYTQTEPTLVIRPSALSPSTSRTASYESGSSNGSRPRSTTPRPSQPLITVSLSPDNLSEYKDLFTRPPQDSDLTPSPSPPPPNSRLPKSDTPIYPRRGQTPASAIAAAHRQATNGDDRSPSRSSRYSRKNSDSDKETSAPSGAQESPRLVPPDGEKNLSPSLQRHPSTATGSVQSSENANSTIRSRMKPPTPARTRPPSMPLPQPPVLSAPPPELPFSPIRQTFNAEPEAASAQKMIARPRAHTIGSVANSSLPAALLTPKTTETLSPPSMDLPEANFDIETASAPQLRAALKARNQQYDELASYVVKVTEAHVTEVTNLEKKVLALDKEVAKKDKEVARKDKELKGLRWIINNGDSSQPQPLPSGILNHSLLSPTSTPSESDQDNSKMMSGVSRRLYYQSDSGTESHTESMSIRSAASGSDSVSSIRHKSLRKPSTLAEVTYDICRTPSTRRPSKLPPGLGAEKSIPELPNKRSSLNSVSPSPSSSTSSLLPPSPSITMSSLSAIPEGPPSALRPSLRYDNSDQEERGALRASHRASTSSMTSSSTAASSAYSGNIKRSRPPSIAQVLEKSPIMDDMLEKLRPFA